ncbi:MAG TPA: DinB family protein [Ktedonobacteraceae bacterium]|nr:DinB family protein [Ktedonobacteraceae bacterium]
MTVSPSNPKVAAIRQDAQQSYDALNQLIDDPLSQLPSEKLYVSPGDDEWTIMENLAHIVEFMPYWGDQVAKLVAHPGQNFGRVQQDERRLKEIRDHAHDSLAQIKALLPPSYTRLQEVLASLQDSDLQLTGVHSRFGEKPLEWFMEDFVTGHLRAHLAQMNAALMSFDA